MRKGTLKRKAKEHRKNYKDNKFKVHKSVLLLLLPPLIAIK